MHKKHGFGLVGILLVVVVIGVVGFAGWFVWDQQNTSSSESSDNKKESSETKDNKITSSNARVELEDLGVAVEDNESRGLVLHTTSYKDTFEKQHTLYYISLENNPYESECGNPISIYAAEEAVATGPLGQGNDPSLVFKEVDGNWYSVGVGDRYSGEQYCKSGKEVEGYKEFVEDLIEYVRQNLRSM